MKTLPLAMLALVKNIYDSSNVDSLHCSRHGDLVYITV